MFFYHFSEDPAITSFVPRKPISYPDHPPCVWAIDDWHSPLYFFPRECPRVAFWKSPNSKRKDTQRFLVGSEAKMVIAIESGWLQDMKKVKLYRYTFAPESFSCFDENAGYYTSREKVVPLTIEPVGDLIEKLLDCDVELRITPTLIPLHEAIAASSLNYSMIRMKNANLRNQ